MYKVFINEHCLNLGVNHLHSKDEESVMHLYGVDCQELKILVDYLLKETKALQVFISMDTEEDSLKALKNCFHYLEAAGGKVSNKNEELLLIYRLGKWDLPKGKLEEGESPEEAALREVAEECSIDRLTIEAELEPSYHIYQQNEKLHLKKTFWYAMKTNTLQQALPQKEEGIEEVKWVPKEDLPSLRDKTYASLRLLFS